MSTRGMFTFGAAVLAMAVGAAASAETLTVQAIRDNTLFEDPQGLLSNGAGPFVYVGRTQQLRNRRALLGFDVAAIPPGSVVTSATLTLTVTQAVGGERAITIHRALKTWGEGASNAGDPGGGGAPAASGDATWLDRFFGANPPVLWSVPGGTGVGASPDYVDAASASSVVNDLGPVSWSGPGLAADVQAWVNAPGSNRGWFVIGDETTGGTAKRFASRENLTLSDRPTLVIEYAPACYPNCDGSTGNPLLTPADFVCFLNRYRAGAPYANCDGSTGNPALTPADFVCFLTRYRAGC